MLTLSTYPEFEADRAYENASSLSNEVGPTAYAIRRVDTLNRYVTNLELLLVNLVFTSQTKTSRGRKFVRTHLVFLAPVNYLFQSSALV